MADVIGQGMLFVARVVYDQGGWALLAALVTGGWLLVMACLVAIVTGPNDEL